MGEGNSLCMGTGLFPFASLKPGVKLSWESASEALGPQRGPQRGPGSAAAAAAAALMDADPYFHLSNVRPPNVDRSRFPLLPAAEPLWCGE